VKELEFANFVSFKKECDISWEGAGIVDFTGSTELTMHI